MHFSSDQWFSNVGNFVHQETLGNIWRHFCLSELGLGEMVLVSKEEKLRRQIGKAQHRKTPPPLKNDPV
jgi:hypothetical protein